MHFSAAHAERERLCVCAEFSFARTIILLCVVGFEVRRWLRRVLGLNPSVRGSGTGYAGYDADGIGRAVPNEEFTVVK